MEIPKEKRRYAQPFVERVELDNEISLVLQSVTEDNIPEGDPTSFASGYFNNDPFKTNIG